MDEVLEIINVVVYTGLALVAARFAATHRVAASGWAAATFAALGLVVVMGAIAPEVGADAGRWSPAALYTDVLVILLTVFPYLLHRFVRTLRGRSGTVDRVADAALVGLIAWVVLAPAFPSAEDPQPTWLQVFIAVFLIWWVALLGEVAVRLWRLGSDAPGIVRGRMRLMSIGALLMSLTLLASVLGGEQAGLQTLTTALGWAAALGFLLSLQPPPMLRSLWRARDEIALREAEVGLISAQDPSSAATAVVGAAAAVVGGAGARVTDHEGLVLAEAGDVDPAGALVVSGAHSTVTVTPSQLTPVLGHGEEALLAQLCGHLDLALARLDALRSSEAARAQAEKANEDLQHLVYGVSHDLRNPLVTITGFLQLLDGDQALSERNQMLLDRIGASARYMQGLVDDLLQLSRVGHADVERTEVDLESLVSGIVGDLELRYPELTVEVGPLPAVDMNPVRARQLFANLIENAGRYARSDDGPVHVRVTAQVEDGWSTIDVSDDGQGIPPEQRDRVFQIFQRLGGFDATSEGSGIGLTMCRRIVTDVGGTIHVADTERGTTMRMTLPLAVRPAVRTVEASR